jgi:hypothetical protein
MEKTEHLNIVKRILKHPRLIFLGLIVLFIMILIPTALIIFGGDKAFIKSTLEGYIYNDQGARLEGIVVKVQDQQVQTDKDGFYRISGLTYGVYDINITANGYSDVKESFRLQRFGNTKNFILSKLEYGQIKFNLDLQGKAFFSSEFSVAINDQVLNYDDKFVIDTGKLLTGTYTLRIQSPYYADIAAQVDVKPGLTQQKIMLVPAADIVGEITSWLNGSPAEPDKVEVKNNGIYAELAKEDLVVNRMTIKNYALDSTFTIRITKQGFNTLEKELPLVQGINSLGELRLVPDGKIVTLKDDGFNRQLFVSDLNGRKVKNLVNTTVSCSDIKETLNYAVVKCGSGTFYKISMNDDGVLSGTVSQSGDIVVYDFWSSDIIAANNSDTDKLKKINGSNTTVLYDGTGNITSMVADRTGRVVFSTDDAVYLAKDSKDTIQKISDGQFLVSDISPDGSKTVLLNPTSGEDSNIWIIDNNTLLKTKLTFLPAKHSSAQFINNNEIVYVADSSGSNTLFQQNINSTVSRQLQTGIDDARIIIDTQVLYLSGGGKNYLFDLDSGKLNQTDL